MVKLSEKWTIVKNFMAINLSFLLLFASRNSISSIQPIIYAEKNLGTIGQIISFGFNIFTCLVIPQVIIDSIGFKFTMALGVFLTATYVLVQIHLELFSLILASILTGLGSSLCWTVLGVYLTICSKKYSKLVGKDFKQIQTLFFGISASIFSMSYVIGYGLIGIILETNETSKQNYNTSKINTANDTYDYVNSCGINNCPYTGLNQSKSKPTDLSFFILYIVLMILCGLALLVTLCFMDNIKVEGDQKVSEAKKIHFGERLSEAVRSLIELYTSLDVWLLFPLSFYSGFEMTFVWFEYSRAFATCLLGINYVGWTNILFGIFGSVISFAMTFLLKYIGVQTGIVFMLMSSLLQCTFMLSWTPQPNNSILIFMMAIVFAFSMSVYFGQIRGLYGVYYPSNSASFSAAALSQTFGFLIGSLFSTYYCTRFKTWFLFGNSVLSIISYMAILLRHTFKEKITNELKPRI